MKRLLSTKTLSDIHSRQLAAAGWELTQYDAIRVELLPTTIDRGDRLVIFTSKHAVRACISGAPESALTGVSCLCIWESTAGLVQRAGGRVLETAPYATALAMRIKKEYTGESFVYYAGDRRLDTLPDALTALGADWKEVTAYETRFVKRHLDTAFDGILFFSPSGIQSYTACNTIGSATAYCIGPTTAAEAKKHTNRFIVAGSPGVEALVYLAADRIQSLQN